MVVLCSIDHVEAARSARSRLSTAAAARRPAIETATLPGFVWVAPEAKTAAMGGRYRRRDRPLRRGLRSRKAAPAKAMRASIAARLGHAVVAPEQTDPATSTQRKA